MSISSSHPAPVIFQYIPSRPIIREEVDSPDSVNRATEARALKQIALCARYRQQTGGHATLSHLHTELLRLERAALQHLPHLTYDERMEFIAVMAHLPRVTPRQIEARLDEASDIIMLRELSGIDTQIEDYTPGDVERMRRKWLNVTRKFMLNNARIVACERKSGAPVYTSVLSASA